MAHASPLHNPISGLTHLSFWASVHKTLEEIEPNRSLVPFFSHFLGVAMKMYERVILNGHKRAACRNISATRSPKTKVKLCCDAHVTTRNNATYVTPEYISTRKCPPAISAYSDMDKYIAWAKMIQRVRKIHSPNH